MAAMRFIENLLFSITAFAPAGVVHGCTYFPGRPVRGGIVVAASLLLALLVPLMLYVARKRNVEQLRGEQTKPAGSEAMALFLTYGLPLMTPIKLGAYPYATVAFCVLTVLMLARSRLIAINPVLLILGLTVYEVEADSGVTYYLIRRRADYRLHGTVFLVARLGDICFVEVRDEK